MIPLSSGEISLLLGGLNQLRLPNRIGRKGLASMKSSAYSSLDRFLEE